MSETKLRENICLRGRQLAERGLTHGATGNISVRTDDGHYLMTPTNSALGELDPAELSKVDADGRLVSGRAPTKEAFLHLAMYRKRAASAAVVHLHATHCAAVSCLAGLKHSDCLPALTAYQVMRVGKLPLVPYYPPGDAGLAKAVEERAAEHSAMLLANHGPVVAGENLTSAIHAIEELEQTSKIFLLTRGMQLRCMSEAEIAYLERM